MFLIRFAVIAVIVIMLLPIGPTDEDDNRVGLDRRGANFCDRYPKTCEASVELYSAFRRKLAYSITLVRHALGSQPRTERYDDRRRLSYDSQQRNDRTGDWRAPPNRLGGPNHAGGTLAPNEHSPEWRRD